MAEDRLTEARNPRTRQIDRATTSEIVRLLQEEEGRVATAVQAESEALVELIDRVVACLAEGGRLIYAGAGTSGRLGVLDAAECPPTFGTDPSLVVGLIAGGPEALARSVEGVEDDRRAAREAVDAARVGAGDFLLGIASSGTTPFVQEAVERARARGAETGFLSCTAPPARIREICQVLVTPLVGPEAIAGSTRMKAGTATKLVLNTLTTATMIRLGKVFENLMVDLNAVSLKLVDRSLRMVEEVCRVQRSEAAKLLLAAGGSVKTAIAMRRLGANRAMAERLLDACGGFLAEVLERFAGGGRLPYYSCYPPSASPRESTRLLARLRRGPVRVREALARRREEECREGRPAGDWRGPSTGWTPAQHLSHLIEFEEKAVRPRVRKFLADGFPRFADWPPSDPPPSGDRPASELEVRFARCRERTLALLGRAGPGQFARSSRMGGEKVTLFQFLRGVAHHDEAHAGRLSERIHPALRAAARGEESRPRTGAEGGGRANPAVEDPKPGERA
ncbi:MAG: N-acetylmuramic acid 6-phosphate etherase [Gemmatimonadota bacterium]